MKKIDKFVIGAFLGPFFLTYVVVLFILLTQHVLKYLDEFVGKGIPIPVFGEMLFYFSVNLTTLALPLAVLLSALIAFGNLGQHSELTAIKSAGISLVRVLVPIFILAVGLTIFAFWFNNTIVPKANLKAYSLLYDIRQKKPSFDLKEGAFYNGLPGYSIKVIKKYPDGKNLKYVMIYDHTDRRGNKQVIIADSGQMYTIYDDRYLIIELFRGNSYTEYAENNSKSKSSDDYVRNKFDKSKLVFSLASFDLNRTQEELFKSNKIMRSIKQLNKDIDSLKRTAINYETNLPKEIAPFYLHHQREVWYDTVVKHLPVLSKIYIDSLYQVKIDTAEQRKVLARAVTQARNIKSFTERQKQLLDYTKREVIVFNVEKQKKFTYSVACLVMFFIGAPLGAIIKKGGLGVPVLVSITFFIIFYVLAMTGEKWAKDSIVPVPYGMWGADVILTLIGFFFLRQAHHDARLFETDAYLVFFSKLKNKWRKNKK